MSQKNLTQNQISFPYDFHGASDPGGLRDNLLLVYMNIIFSWSKWRDSNPQPSRFFRDTLINFLASDGTRTRNLFLGKEMF